MKKYRKVYISPGEFEYNKSKGILYEGFVIGVGYAYIRFITPTVKRLLYANPACYYFDTIKVQELDISEETIILSFPPLASEPSSKGLSAVARTAKFALSHPLIAAEIGYWIKGSTNISTNAVRFATRNDVLSGGDGAESNAFRHTLWQSYITNRHGVEIATSIGNAHEENPDVNLRNRRFRTQLDADQTIDLLNNQIGRSLGNTAPIGMRDMALRVLEVFYRDGLYTAKQSEDGSWYIDRTKITQEQYNSLKKFYEIANDFGRSKEEQDEIMKNAAKRDEKLLDEYEKHWHSIR